MPGPDAAKARVFKVDFKTIAVSHGAGMIMDAGLIPPEESSLYWLQPNSGQPHLYAYDLANGRVRDLTALVPEGELPDSISWSSDGSSFVFTDGTNLDLITVKDGLHRVISTESWKFDSRHIYWMDRWHIFSGCEDSSRPTTKVCSCDLGAAKVTAWDIGKLKQGLRTVDGYLQHAGAFLSDSFGPDTPSAFFVSRLGADGLLDSRQIPFPGLNGESDVSATADGKYVLVDTNIGSGDTPLALLIGNTITGRWARIESSVLWGQNFHPKIAPDGRWMTVISWPGGDSGPDGNADVSRLYLARIPQSLLAYLDSKP